SGYKIEPNSSSPTGKIITQWGYGTNTSSGVAQAVVFPTTFPTAVLHVFAQEDNPSGTWVTGMPTVHCAGDVTATGFNEYRLSWNGTAWSGGSAAAFRYIAIGN
ncbi:MAG: hypothetical protein P4L71_00380, partial [Acetobacteraceae bacterium]|nr:hypothetical protein [Acetobacteraceae bacterium]